MPKSRAIQLLAAFSLAYGCSADPGGSGAGQTVAPVATVGQDGKCTQPGTQQCFCDNGTGSGTQTCMPNGSLTACLCPAANGSAASGSTALCKALQGQTGCMAHSFQSAKLPASILFLVDRSGSMNCNLPPLQSSADCEMVAKAADATQPTKWQVVTKALKDAFGQLKAANANASLGLTFFSRDDMCGVNSKPVVSVGPLTDSNLTTLNTILDSTMAAGGTPIIGATILAYQYMHQEAGAGIECPGPMCPCSSSPCGASGNRYVVLLTDGQESCAANPTELQDWTTRLLDTEAPKAVRANVRTFVVGSPGSEPSRGFLSDLAFQGGTARNGGMCNHDRNSPDGDCHFDMTKTQDFATDLATALTSISGSALSCQFSVPTALDSQGAKNVNVQFTAATGGGPQCIARDDGKACDGGANGWQFAKLPDGSSDLTKVVLCGSACDMVKKDPGARVDVLVGCQSIVVQ